GEALLEKVLATAPLSYYAALAATRLDAASPGRAHKALSALLRSQTAPLVEHVEAKSAKDPSIEAATELAGAQDPRGVEDALATIGLRDPSASVAHYLFAAQLVAIAGDRQAAHQLLRSAREREMDPGKFDCDVLVRELPRGEAKKAWELAFPKLFGREVETASSE